MYRLFLIAKNQMKKQKGDMFTFLILNFISAFLIFDCACAIFGLGRVMESRFRSINGAHVMIYNYDSKAQTTCAERAFKEDTHITDYERTPVIQMMADYRKKGGRDYSAYQFMVESFTQKKRIMKIEVPDREYSEDDILLPYHLKSGYHVGDVFQIRLGEDEYDFRVAGYLEDPYFCNTMNITLFYVSMSEQRMEELADKHPTKVRWGFAHKGIADERLFTDSFTTAELEEDITGRYQEYLSECPDREPWENYTDYLSVNWHMMRGGSQFFPMIVTAILLLFAVLILLISLIIISFSIQNFIRRNMKNTGILEASGYTVGELRCSLILQILFVGMLGALSGILAAVATFGQFGKVLGAVLGLSWNQPVNLYAALGTVLGIQSVIGLVGLRISSTYKKISVLDALRGGIHTHNYKKNLFTLEKTPLPVPVVLALKDTFGGWGRNVVMVLVSAILVIATLIGIGLVENFAKDTDGLMKMMAFEMCTDMVTASENGENLSDGLSKVGGVEKVLVNVGFEPTLYSNDREKAVYCYAVDDLYKTSNTNLLEGRYPEKDNEILITSGVVRDFDLKPGDVVEIGIAGKKEEYLITGINQRMERMGRTIYMRTDGAKKIFPGDITGAYQYYVTAEEECSYEKLKNAIDQYADEKGLELQHNDMYGQMQSTIATVVLALNAICLAIVVITVIVVVFVESLVIRAKIAREWRSMGISKAIGQTSGGLITQIMLSNLPAILIGALIGGIISPFAGNGMVRAMFSLFAIKKVDFAISCIDILLTVAGIVIVAILTSAAAGLKVKKLKAVTMIMEE